MSLSSRVLRRGLLAAALDAIHVHMTEWPRDAMALADRFREQFGVGLGTGADPLRPHLIQRDARQPDRAVALRAGRPDHVVVQPRRWGDDGDF